MGKRPVTLLYPFSEFHHAMRSSRCCFCNTCCWTMWCFRPYKPYIFWKLLVSKVYKLHPKILIFDPLTTILTQKWHFYHNPQNIGPTDFSWSLYQHISKPKCFSITIMVLPKLWGFLGVRAALTINCLYTSLHLVEQDDKEKIWWTCNAVQWLVSCSTA